MNITTFFTALVLLGFSSFSLAQYKKLDAIVAIVDDDVITESDLHEKIQLVEKNLQTQNIDLPKEEIRTQVIDRLILESLQLQMAKRAGVTVNDEELNQAMNNIASRNGMNLAEFYEELQSQGIDYQAMREQIRKEMLIQQVQQGNLHNHIQISDQDVTHFLASSEGQQITATRYHLQHILLPVDEDADAAQQAKDKQALNSIRTDVIQQKRSFDALLQGQTVAGYKISGQDFGFQSMENLPSLFADAARTMQTGDISEPLRSGAGWHLIRLAEKTGGSQWVEQTHARHILISLSEVRNDEQAHALATKLYEEILQGGDFSLLAKEYSADKGSALQGGDLGWSQAGQFVPEFEQTLSELAVEEVSRPIRSQFGWHIIQKLAERRQDMTKEQWKAQARQAIYERRFADELDAWLGKIRNEAFVEVK